ncbi:hypothetical protein [Dendronalium sp. ChiSLP03b]|uniref:hypothetical protein n=1 Tax=Dendronalium sp. ChiSLP03b TaxID=3075381 RepID=UPI002AD3210B|nr:hypothetical protein [Dendronalium sp. ChiSLP03b]MDZ8208442.1 hypothetical protein [Dendronalium sp. ChiSLP03b]
MSGSSYEFLVLAAVAAVVSSGAGSATIASAINNVKSYTLMVANVCPMQDTW